MAYAVITNQPGYLPVDQEPPTVCNLDEARAQLIIALEDTAEFTEGYLSPMTRDSARKAVPGFAILLGGYAHTIVQVDGDFCPV